MFGGYSCDVYVYRATKRNNWGELPPASELDKDVPFGVLYGKQYSHKIVNASIAPRTSNDYQKSPTYSPIDYAAKTMYCDPEDDVKEGDNLVFTNYAGKREVWQVDGEGNMDWVSPFSNFVGGKEVFITKLVRQSDM